MLSAVVLMNEAMDVGDRAALWKQLSSSVAGLSNVEDEYAQRWALSHRNVCKETTATKTWAMLSGVEWSVDVAHHLCLFIRYMDELMRLKAAAREQGSDYLTWNDIQACIDHVNMTVQEEHERRGYTHPHYITNSKIHLFYKWYKLYNLHVKKLLIIFFTRRYRCHWTDQRSLGWGRSHEDAGYAAEPVS